MKPTSRASKLRARAWMAGLTALALAGPGMASAFDGRDVADYPEASRRTVTLHANNIATTAAWTNESYAAGAPDDQYAHNDNLPSGVFLWANDFDNWTGLGPCEVITNVEVDVRGRYDANSTNCRWRLAVKGPIAQVEKLNSGYTQSGTNMDWVFATYGCSGGECDGSRGWSIFSKKASWSSGDIDSLQVGVAFESSNDPVPPNLMRVDSFRIVVTIADLPASVGPSGIATSVAPPRCPGECITLTVQGGSLGSGANWVWYAGGCGNGAAVGTGPSITVCPGSAATYWVRAEGPCGVTGCAGIGIPVKSLSQPPTGVSASPPAVCPGGSTQLCVQGGALGTGAQWKWYAGGCGGTHVGVGQCITVAPSSTTQYCVRAEGDCNTTACACTTVVVKVPSQAPAGVSASPPTICPGQFTQLCVQGGALGTGAQWKWYAGGCGGTPVGSGPCINVAPATTTQYCVRAEGDCNSTACACVLVTVLTPSQAPSGITSDSLAICPGASTTLCVQGGALGTGATWHWYKGGCGAAPAGTGACITVSEPGQYCVRAEGECNTTACVCVTVSHKSLSSAPTGVSSTFAAICPDGETTLCVQGGELGAGATWRWYQDSCSGTLLGTGPCLTVSEPGQYCVRGEGECNVTECVCTTVGAKAVSTAPTSCTADPIEICPGGTTTLSQHGGTLGTGAVWKWYSGACGSTYVGSGSSINVSPAAPTDYYVRAEGDCNVTTCCGPVHVAISTAPTPPDSAMVAPNGVCGGTMVTLSALGGSGGVKRWYKGNCGGTPIGEGETLQIPAPCTTTDYCVRVESSCGLPPSPCKCVTLFVTAPVAPEEIIATPNPACVGEPVQLCATGGSCGTIVWYADNCGAGTPLGTGSCITITAPPTLRGYFARMEGPCGNSGCSSVIVYVKEGPTVQVTPTYIGLPTDETAVFHAAIGGTPPFEIQWFKDGDLLSNASSPDLTLPDLTLADSGQYSVVVKNFCNPIGAASHGTLKVWCRGDMNCDEVVDFKDIDPFVRALSNPTAYGIEHPDCVYLNGDCTGDGVVTFKDIDCFVASLGHCRSDEPQDGDGDAPAVEAFGL